MVFMQVAAANKNKSSNPDTAAWWHLSQTQSTIIYDMVKIYIYVHM